MAHGRELIKRSLMLGVVGVFATGYAMSSPVTAQEAAEPAAQSDLPPVEVIQKKAVPAKKAAAPSAAKKQAPSAIPEPVGPDDDLADAAPGSDRTPDGRRVTNTDSLSPVNPTDGILPADIQDFPGSAARITRPEIDQLHPLNNHEALVRVPGVTTVTDDGMGRHSGIGIRGSAHRRSRKILVMEDGQPINFSTYLDSSTHYTPPIERVESIEVMKGVVLNYGPLNNHGVINFRNLNPFGANETLIKAGIGHTEGANKDLNNFRHVHTRQNLGNVGVVASYSGMDAGGAWDVEELGYDDFYGAIGFRDSQQDLTISGGYFRQRDTYDEDNFGDGTQAEFFANGHNKTRGAANGFFEAPCCHDLSSYNADYYRLQAAHNYYVDSNTTITTRAYLGDHERARFYNGEDAVDDTRDGILMEGRDRRYRNYGVDSRVELANLPLGGGITHDLQAGVRYEQHRFSNKNREGEVGEVLDFDNRGELDSITKLEADSFAAFVQTAIHLTNTLTITPGVRFENYEIDFNAITDGVRGDADYNHVLPGIGFAWEALPRNTIYGGYHRGLTPHIVRDANEDVFGFVAPKEEIGDNFELGLRSTAVRGLTLDFALFHDRIENYQFGEAFQSDEGDRVFSALDEVTLQGFEIGARVDSQPFTGGPWNLFGEAVYTYVDSEIDKGEINDEDDGISVVTGNEVPEVTKHFANLTFGIAHRVGWDASVTWTYRGAYYTDALNLSFAEEGEVPEVWLLSARSNLKVTDQLSLFVSGSNLTDEFYISDRSDGMKPGIGRTVMGGFEFRF